MIKPEQGGSMYDFMSNDHTAPTIEQAPVREAGWQANRPKDDNKYRNRMPNHVKEAMTIEQKDNSYYEFENLAWGRNPKDSFGQSVNFAFGELEKDYDFRAEKKRYIELYRKLMEEL